MLGPRNAQDFIRALKASSDPPHVGEPLKIDIAREAWQDTQLYVPNKAEAIVEWLLTRLLKDKSKDRATNPICDSRYWNLLYDILVSSGGEKHGDHSRALRAWLVPLLTRVPIAPIILSYLELASSEGPFDIAQYTLFLGCVSVLWPLAVPKFSPETLLECFGAVVHFLVARGGTGIRDGPLQNQEGSRALSLIVSSYRGILSNAGSKRKQLYTQFLQKYLQSWLQVTTRSCEGQDAQPQLVSDIYDAGIDTLFGLDLLKPAADQKHDSALADAFEHILQVSSDIVLRPLPRLFASYVQTIKRHKGALFGQGSNQASGQAADQLQAIAMGFYALCGTLARAVTDDVSWRCRVALLEVVEKENLFNAKDNDAKALLRQDGEVATETLSSAWDDQHASRTDAAVQILTLLTRIDYDLMSPSSAIVFPRLLAIPASVGSALRYLDLLLEYDSKTRNLPSSIMHISEAFSVQHLQRIPGGPRSAYEVASGGPLTSLPFLDALSRAVHSFLTPGQVLETVKDVSQALHEAYERFLEQEAKLFADRGEGPRKKRRKQGSMVEDRTEPEYHAVSFALMARTMVAILRSLPLHTLTDDVRLDAEKAVSEVHASVACRALREGLLQPDRRDCWHWQAIVLGALRLHYGLASQPQPQQLRVDEPLLFTMLSWVSEPGVAPELVVEMFRSLLHQCSCEALSPQAVLDKLLAILEKHPSVDKTSWTGKAHVLHSEAEAALALLHILTDRWLPHFDAWATPDQHKRFARVLTATNLDLPALKTASGLTVPAVISRMLHDAQFWELLNIRDVFLAQLVEQTSLLDGHELPTLISQLASDAPHLTTDDIFRCVSIYDILLLTPQEYLPRPTHVEFLKRGFVLDVLVFAKLRNANDSVSPRHLLVIREFLRRTIAYLGSVENVVTKEFLEYLIVHTTANTSDAMGASNEVSSVTMELVDMYQSALVRAAKRGSSSVITELLARYAGLYDTDGPTTGRKSSLLLIDSFVQEGAAADFPEDVVNSIRDMNDRMLAFILKQLPSSPLDTQESPVHIDFLDTWSHLQILRRWLKCEDVDQLPALGKPLVRRLLAWTGDRQEVAQLAPTVLAILLGEVQAANTPHGERLEYVVVAYLALVRLCDQHEIKQLESRLSSAFRTLSTEEFSTVLELIFDGLPLGRGLSVEDVANLVRFAMTSLQHAPEGTSRICQSFTTRCLNLFADDDHFVTNRELRAQIVDFVVRQCGDRPASLRVADLPSLWSLLRSLLAGSSTHEQSTDIPVFHGIVNMLSALVRLRRDLVLNTLPHLGFVLRQLVFCLRSLRPQLGGKQSRMVMDTLPRWIAPSQPLGAQESKALARLLTTLTTKTMIRVHGAAAETQKPESLVRPFSKHAAYVLTAYVEAVNDPLCFVSSGVRRELQPGLFALCDMLGEHNRDAMMVSALDTGGKATMKALWKEYEKQRYVGKG